MGESPSRPSSGASNHGPNDPFKVLGAGRPQLKPTARPTYSRQATAPVGMHQRPQAQRTNIFGLRGQKSPEKENRPPSSHARTNSAVPVISTSPKRTAIPIKEAKALTPSRKAPPPPAAVSNVLNKGTNLAKQAYKNKLLQSPVRGRSLQELAQARSQPNLLPPDMDFDDDGSETIAAVLKDAPDFPPSPAKWDYVTHGDEMPSPFLAKKMQSRVMVR